MTADEITHGDMKEFDFPQGKVTVAQVNVMDGEKAKAKWPELQKSLQAMVDKGEADTSLLMVTDIMDEVTELLWVRQEQGHPGQGVRPGRSRWPLPSAQSPEPEKTDRSAADGCVQGINSDW